MQVRLLGTVELVGDGGRVVPIPPPKRRTLLAALAIELNRVVSVDRLLDIIWDGSPPPSARTALQVHVSGLRKLLTSDLRLDTRSNSYMLTGPRSCVDAVAFDDLVTDAGNADGATAIEKLREAVLLWRGPPFADAPSRELQETVAAGLEDRRLGALESLAGHLIAAGRANEILADLTSAVDQNALRESLVQMLMLGLSAANRQADALSLYDRTRRQLADNLGVDPGPQLQAMYQRVLNSQPVVSAESRAAPDQSPDSYPVAHTSPSELPRDVAGFVGRAAELEWLDTTAAPNEDGSDRRIAVVVGPAGIGKTSLAIRWAHCVADQFPDGQLFVDLRGFGDTDPLSVATALNSMLRSLGTKDSSIPRDPDAQVALYRTSVARQRLLLILDNARSAEQVRPLLPTGPGSLAVVTSRNRLNGLVVQEGASTLQIDPLTRKESLDLLADMLGGERLNASIPAAGRVAALCDDLPLALRIAGAQLAARPHRAITDLADELADEQLRLSALEIANEDISVETSLSFTYRSLSEQVRRFFLLLGLHPGTEIDPYAAAATAAVPVREAKRLLANLAVVHLLKPATGSSYAMNDLVRTYCRQVGSTELIGTDRHHAFARLVNYYVALAGAGRVSLTERIFVPDQPVSRWAPAAVPVFESGAAALRWFTTDEPTIRSLVRLAYEAGLHTEAWRLTNNAIMAYMRCGTDEHFIATATTAVLAATAGGDRFGLMVAHKVLGMAYLEANNITDARASLRRALEIAKQEPEDSREARVVRLTMLAALGRSAGIDLDDELDDDLIVHSELPESPFYSAARMFYLSQARLALGKVEGTLELVEEGLGIVEAHGLESLRHQLGYAHGQVLRRLGRLDEAAARYVEARDMSYAIGDLRTEAACLYDLMEIAEQLGRSADALRYRNRAAQLQHQLEPSKVDQLDSRRRARAMTIGNRAVSSN